MTLVATASLVLVGCAGGSGGDAASDAPATGSDPAGKVMSARQDAPAGAASAEKGSSSAEKGRGDSAPLPQHGKIVSTATLTVRVPDVADAIRTARNVTMDAGGHVYASHRFGGAPAASGDSRDSRERAKARLTLKVPPESFRTVLDRLDTKLGALLERQIDTEDVTGKVADVNSRVDSARASIARLRALMQRADSVDDVLAVEGELAEREADLESLEAKQKALQQQLAYATIHLHMRGPVPQSAAMATAPLGFLSGFAAGWGAFTSFCRWLVAALGASLPFLLVIAAAIVAAWRTRRFVRARRSPGSPSP